MASASIQGSAEFSLTPAIFVPFHGIPADESHANTREERLRRILENLDKQHAAVRRNMMYLVSVQKEKILAEAKEALRLEAEKGEQGEEDKPVLNAQEEKDLLARLRGSVRKGAGVDEYQYSEEEAVWKQQGEKNGPKNHREAGDAELGVTVTGGGRRARAIREDTSRRLRELVSRAAHEMTAYDKHAEGTCEYYRRALERNAIREAGGV